MAPLYTFECEDCERIEERLMGIKERDEGVLCENCEQPMKKVLDCSHFVIKGYAFKHRNFYTPPKKGGA